MRSQNNKIVEEGNVVKKRQLAFFDCVFDSFFLFQNGISCLILLLAIIRRVFRDWSKSIGGVGGSREGVGQEVLSLVQGVGRAIFSYSYGVGHPIFY